MKTTIATISLATALCCFVAAACLASPVLLAAGTANLTNAVVFADWGGED